MKRLCAALLAIALTGGLAGALTAALPAVVLGSDLHTVPLVPSSRDNYPRSMQKSTTTDGVPLSVKRFKSTKDSTGRNRKAMSKNPASLQ